MAANFRSAIAWVGVACALLMPAAATAAQLAGIQGNVNVNRGDGFVPAVTGMEVMPGDQIFVGPTAAASVVYSEPTCVFEIAPATVVTLAETAPCTAGQSAMSPQSILITPAADVVLPPADPDLTPFYVMGGGAIIGATALIISETTNEDGGSGGFGDGDPGHSPGGSISTP